VRLSETQKAAVLDGSGTRWLGTRETGVRGNTMYALAQRQLAEVREAERPYRRFVFRLTAAGVAKRDELRPVEDCTEDELIARFTDGRLTLDEYGAERERRAGMRP
jgi:hypothetical protein